MKLTVLEFKGNAPQGGMLAGRTEDGEWYIETIEDGRKFNAMHDAVGVVDDNGRMLVPVSWVIKEHPEKAEFLNQIVAKLEKDWQRIKND